MGLWMSATLQTTKGKKPKYPQRNYTIFLDEVSDTQHTSRRCTRSPLLQDTSQPEEWPSVDELTYFIGSIVSVGELAAQSCIMAVVSCLFALINHLFLALSVSSGLFTLKCINFSFCILI